MEEKIDNKSFTPYYNKKEEKDLKERLDLLKKQRRFLEYPLNIESKNPIKRFWKRMLSKLGFQRIPKRWYKIKDLMYRVEKMTTVKELEQEKERLKKDALVLDISQKSLQKKLDIIDEQISAIERIKN